MNRNQGEKGAAYLPERYRQQIEAKKRRRLIKKIVVICALITISMVVYMVLSGGLGSLLSQSTKPPESTELSTETLSFPSPTASQTNQSRNSTGSNPPAVIFGTGITDQPVSGVLSLTEAIASLRQDYPDPPYTLISANLTNQYTNNSLYEFRIRPAGSPLIDPGFPVFIDAGTGDPYIPGQEIARISAIQAKNLVRDTFFIMYPDRIRVRYYDSPDSAKAWIFSVHQENTTIITGSLDPDSGQIVSFSRAVSRQGRQGDPVLETGVAQEIADRYIVDRNGAPLPVKMSESWYDPLGFSGESVAGHYVFVYNRIVQGIPCDNDGFTISVDSVTGEVTEYERRWNSPDNAFSVAVDPLVKRYEAIFLVQQKAQETFPASASGLRIISTEIRWDDLRPPGNMPRPGSISIAWKVQFDDDSIRAKQWAVPASGWIDARTGEVLDFNYEH